MTKLDPQTTNACPICGAVGLHGCLGQPKPIYEDAVQKQYRELHEKAGMFDELMPIMLRRKSQPKVEGGWVIERGDTSAPEYITVPDGMGFNWTKDNLQALRFARREDADMVAIIIDVDAERICYHEWG